MHHSRVLNPAQLRSLRETTLFSHYADDEFQLLSKLCHYQYVPAHTVLFVEDAPCSAFYLLLSGFVELYRSGPQDQKKVVDFIEAGQTFAEAAMFSGQGYPVSAVTLLDSDLIVINSMRFNRFLQAYPQVSWKILATMSVRLHQLVSQVTALGLFNAEQKVAAYLLEHCEDEGPPYRVTHLPHRRIELASRLGMSAETLCRVLSLFKKQAWVDTEDNQIILLQIERLQGLLK